MRKAQLSLDFMIALLLLFSVVAVLVESVPRFPPARLEKVLLQAEAEKAAAFCNLAYFTNQQLEYNTPNLTVQTNYDQLVIAGKLSNATVQCFANASKSSGIVLIEPMKRWF